MLVTETSRSMRNINSCIMACLVIPFMHKKFQSGQQEICIIIDLVCMYMKEPFWIVLGNAAMK